MSQFDVQNNSLLHGCALVGTLVLSGALFVAVLYLTETGDLGHESPRTEMMTIEAQLARKAEKTIQAQKERKAPEPPIKPEGVSHDESKPPPDTPKQDRNPTRKDDKPPDIHAFKHPSDDEPQLGVRPVTDIGEFDGSDKGFAPLNTGDPYWRAFNADLRQGWEIPQISKVNGTAVGCFHIEPDGKIAGVRFDTPSGDEILDDSVQRSIKILQKARNDKPQPVPTAQLGVIKKWVCFRFNPNQ